MTYVHSLERKLRFTHRTVHMQKLVLLSGTPSTGDTVWVEGRPYTVKYRSFKALPPTSNVSAPSPLVILEVEDHTVLSEARAEEILQLQQVAGWEEIK